jgi:hypothetical protein
LFLLFIIFIFFVLRTLLTNVFLLILLSNRWLELKVLQDP